MIGEDLTEVFADIPKQLKARVVRIKEATGESISHVILMALQRVVPELEQELKNRPKGPPPSSSSPKRRQSGKSKLSSASQWSFPPLNGEGSE